jgi:hypothetical protein
LVKEFSCPPGAFVVPESLEILFEEVGPHGLQVDGDKLLKFDFSSTVQAGLLGVTSCNYIAVL